MQPFLVAALTMVSIAHTMAAVSRPVAGFMLSALQVVLVGAMFVERSRHSATPMQRALMTIIPKDVRSAMKLLGLVPDIKKYGCCPSCFAIYPADPTRPNDPFPRHCTHKDTKQSEPCGAALVFEHVVEGVQPGTGRQKCWLPFRTYPTREAADWIAEFFLRPGMEDYIRESWKDSGIPGQWTDVMHAPAIRELVGPDGKTLFSVQGPGEIHLVFSLFVDWFNPRGNKAAGKSHSIGAIYLACLNLPPKIRFRPENIFLAGIIPGPSEPSNHQLNHLLRPLVDQLLELWNPGIFLATTAAGTGGRRVRAAVIPLVCDLPAMRKTAGYHSYKSINFCSFCRLSSRRVNDVDRSTWPPGYSWIEHLFHARQWRDAETPKARKDLLGVFGLRWSELLRLPYWDPTRYALLDAMHNLYLGELRHHCMDVWGLREAEKRGKPLRTKAHTPEQQSNMLRRILNGLERKSVKTIERARLDYLSAVARYNDIDVPEDKRTKLGYAQKLVDWVRHYPALMSAGHLTIHTGEGRSRRICGVPASPSDDASHTGLPYPHRRAQSCERDHEQ